MSVKINTGNCMLCHQSGTVEVTEEQHDRLVNGKGKIQEVLPDVPAEVREQLISGTHPACWDDAFKDDEEE